uniref:Uncharacterized protein n=1 Tax=Meloidogyne hapla TaxID=6305 RepID=A0A1I8BY45_MELHA
MKREEVYDLIFEKYLHIVRMIAIEQTNKLKANRNGNVNAEAQDHHKTKPKIVFDHKQKQLVIVNDRSKYKVIEAVHTKQNFLLPKEPPSFVYPDYKGISTVLSENTSKAINKTSQSESGISSKSPKKDETLERTKDNPITFEQAIGNMNLEYFSIKDNTEGSPDYYTAESNFGEADDFEKIEKSEADLKNENEVNGMKKNEQLKYDEDPWTSISANETNEEVENKEITKDIEDDFVKI